MFVLAEVPVATDSVGLATDVPTAATQAPWLPSLGLVSLLTGHSRAAEPSHAHC